ncbi:MAG: DUF2306 domain-containing protein [Bacteroidota bacterium]
MELTNTISPTTNVSKASATTGLGFLKATGKIWFVAAVLGQWIFAYYVAAFYGGSAIQGNLKAWEEVLPHGMIEGDAMGNIALAGHLLLAVIIIVFGPLQFIPKFRKALPKFHRWNGRVYLFAVVLTSLFGLYMIWTRGTVGGTIMRIGTSLDGVLIIVFSVIALRLAVQRKFEKHLRWAMRLFIVVSGVWFFRVGLMFWIVINGGPAGFDPETFQGPFLSFWTFGQYLLPLAILELYYLAQDRAKATGRFAMGGSLLLWTLAMLAGTVVATMGMWLPRL